MKNTCKVLVGLVTLALVLISLWATFQPVTAYAATSSARCANGTTVSCSGVSCISGDATSSSNGYCFCTREDGTNDVKFCANLAPTTRPGTD
jgi:hypothetical protein